MYEYSSWRHKFGKSWDRWKYENLNISRTEQNFYETKKIVNLCLRWHVLRSYWLRSWPLNSLNWIEWYRPVSLRRASQVWTKTLSDKQFTTQRRAKRYCEHRLNKEGPQLKFQYIYSYFLMQPLRIVLWKYSWNLKRKYLTNPLKNTCESRISILIKLHASNV